MSATVWLVLTATGFALLRSMAYMRHEKLRAIAVRAAAFAFIGAGTIGAAGWLGKAITALVTGANRVGGQASLSLLGTSAVWIVWAGLGIAWVLTLLPRRWFSLDIPDWLSVTGLVLPALAVSIQGPVGETLRTVTDTVGGLMVAGAQAAVGA